MFLLHGTSIDELWIVWERVQTDFETLEYTNIEISYVLYDSFKWYSREMGLGKLKLGLSHVGKTTSATFCRHKILRIINTYPN